MAVATVTVHADGSSRSIPITIGASGTTPVAPWSSGFAALQPGAVPTRPPYSNLKGSASSMVIEPSPWTPVENALRYTNSDAELTSSTPAGRTPPSSSHNPGVALCGPNMQFREGTEAWIRWRFQLPASVPKMVPVTATNQAFFLIGELHGGVNVNGVETWVAPNPGFSEVPFGSPATALVCWNLAGREVIGMARGWLPPVNGQPKGYDVIWATPLVRDQLFEVVFHMIFSADPAIGLREVWLNGVQQAFVDGRWSWTNDFTLHQVPSTAAFPQALWGATECLTAYQMLYFTKGLYAPSSSSPVVVYHGDLVIGNSLVAVS